MRETSWLRYLGSGSVSIKNVARTLSLPRRQSCRRLSMRLQRLHVLLRSSPFLQGVGDIEIPLVVAEIGIVDVQKQYSRCRHSNAAAGADLHQFERWARVAGRVCVGVSAFRVVDRTDQ